MLEVAAEVGRGRADILLEQDSHRLLFCGVRCQFSQQTLWVPPQLKLTNSLVVG